MCRPLFGHSILTGIMNCGPSKFGKGCIERHNCMHASKKIKPKAGNLTFTNISTVGLYHLLMFSGFSGILGQSCYGAPLTLLRKTTVHQQSRMTKPLTNIKKSQQNIHSIILISNIDCLYHIYDVSSAIYSVLSQQTHYVTTTLPTGCILVRSVSTLSAREGHIPKLRNFTTL